MRKWVVWRNGRIFGLLLVLLLGLQPTVIALSPLPQAPAQEPAPIDDLPDVATPTPAPDEGSGGTVVTVPERVTATPTPTLEMQDDTAVSKETAVIAEPASPSAPPAGWFTDRDCSQPLRVMPLGNSITAGRGSGPAGEEDEDDKLTGYRYPLYLSLTSASYQFDFVGIRNDGYLSGFSFDYDNQGTPGQTLTQMNGMVNFYLSENPPDLILLHLGTNDILQNATPAVVQSRMNTLLDYIDTFDSTIPVIVAQIINERNNESNHATALTTYNDLLQTLVSTRIAGGDLLTLVDMEPVLNYSAGSPDFYDKWHPNTTGYNKMDDVWFARMQEIWPTCIEITSTAVTAATPSQFYTYDVDANADPEPVTYSLLTKPDGMTINSSTGVITWTPMIAQLGSQQVEVQAANGSKTVTQQFTVIVEAEYEIYLPIIENFSPPAAAQVGQPYSYQVQVSGGTVMTYTLNNAPDFMSINGTGLISWTPTLPQTGAHTNVEVVAANNDGSDSAQFSVQVNAPPQITSTEPNHIAVVGEEYTHSVTASGEPVPEFSIDAPIPSGMQIGLLSGIITWTPTGLGDEEITVRASNGVNPDATQTFTIPVYEKPDISTTAVTIATVDQLYQYDVDANGTPLPTYSLVIQPNGMTIDSNTGIISWTPNSAQTGNHAVQVRATNLAGTADQTFNVYVQQVPQLTLVPGDTTITAGQSFNGSAAASGAPTPTFSLINNTPGWLSIHPTTGQITGNATQANAGINNVTIQAENAAGVDTDLFTITVESAAMCLYDPASYWPLDVLTNNTSPDMVWSNNGKCSGSTCPDVALGVNGNALDFDSSEEDGLDIPNPSRLDWDEDSSFTIQVWVNSTQACLGDDNKVITGSFSGGPSEGTWWLGCSQTNNAAVIYLDQAGGGGPQSSLIGTQVINDGQWHQVTAVREASAGQTRLYVDGVLDASLNVNYSNTFATSTPLHIGYFGTIHQRHFYFDGLIDDLVIYNRALTETEIEQHYNYTNAGVGYCSETAVSPQIISSAQTQAVINHQYTYDVNATGLPSPTYSLVTTPAGMTIDPATGMITWTPTSGQIGQHNVEVQATNSGGDSSQAFNIEVDLHLAPSITSTPITEVMVGEQYTYNVEANGEPAPEFSLVGAYPSGMTIDSNTGLIEWNVPNSHPEGPVTITVQATNIVDSDTQTFDIFVKKYSVYLPIVLK